MQAILRPPQLAEYLGMSLRSVYRLEETDPTFPRKVMFSPRCVGFRREAVDKWLEMKERQAA